MPDPFVLVVVWLICGLLAWWIAERRGLPDKDGWMITGFVLGPIGLLWALVKRP